MFTTCIYVPRSVSILSSLDFSCVYSKEKYPAHRKFRATKQITPGGVDPYGKQVPQVPVRLRQEVPQVPEVPEVPKVPEVPTVPQVPQVPECPVADQRFQLSAGEDIWGPPLFQTSTTFPESTNLSNTELKPESVVASVVREFCHGEINEHSLA